MNDATGRASVRTAAVRFDGRARETAPVPVRMCDQPGCDQPAEASGWCGEHDPFGFEEFAAGYMEQPR